jgi:hypothetical protein
MLPALWRDASIHHVSRVKKALTSEHNKEIKSMLMVVSELRAPLDTGDDNYIHPDVIMAQDIFVMHLSADLLSIQLKTLHRINF